MPPQDPTMPPQPTPPAPTPEANPVPAPDNMQAPAPQNVQTVPMGDGVVQPPANPGLNTAAPSMPVTKSSGSKGVMIAAIVGGLFVLGLLAFALLAG